MVNFFFRSAFLFREIFLNSVKPAVLFFQFWVISNFVYE